MAHPSGPKQQWAYIEMLNHQNPWILKGPTPRISMNREFFKKK